jgi:bifunctional DNase/RNase
MNKEIEVEISRIIISEIMDAQAVLLKEKNGKRTLPIIIGVVEALALDREIKTKKAIRPMTHDLLISTLDALNCILKKVVINDLKEGTFYAEMYLEQYDNKYKLDCRPSDALVLATHFKTPIYVSENVFKKIDETSPPEEI